MTITEINNLVLADVQETLEYRVISANYDIDNPEVVHEPSQEELDAEFVLYKAELIETETERLRVLDLNTRIDALIDMPYAHINLSPSIPNAALYVKQTILQNTNHQNAEDNLVVLEAKDAELQAAISAVSYMEERKKVYPTISELIVAMWEGDQIEIDRLEAIRQQVKSDIPKP